MMNLDLLDSAFPVHIVSPVWLIGKGNILRKAVVFSYLWNFYLIVTVNGGGRGIAEGRGNRKE
jgi:hypothetical protein